MQIVMANRIARMSKHSISQLAMQRSGLQRDVLALYRRALRMVKTKPESTQSKFLLFVRYTFHQNAKSVSSRDISAIEHLFRKGTRQLEMYEDPGVKDCFVSNDMLTWEERRRKGSTSK